MSYTTYMFLFLSVLYDLFPRDARERTRTSTPLRAYGPQPYASASSATRAWGQTVKSKGFRQVVNRTESDARVCLPRIHRRV